MFSVPQDPFAYALSSNQAWAGYKGHQNPEFFSKLAAGQSPSILWLGCSDSRCPETTILGLQPGDVFTHRNIANIVSPTDINTSAVIEYAVTHVRVRHVVLCGHTSCGGAAAALADARVGGVLDTWLTPLRALRDAHRAELDAIADGKARAARIAELNVEAGVAVLMANATVREHVEDRGLQVHGTLFDIASGRVRDLGLGTAKGGGAGKASAERADSGGGRDGVGVGVGVGVGGGGGGEVVRGKHAMLVFRNDGAAMQAQ